MTQLQFNLNLDILKESVMDSNIDSVIKASIVLVLNEFMEKERDHHLKAHPYERTTSRHDYRNGYYDRELLLSIGKIVLRVPRTRSGDFSTTVFEQYARCDQAFVLSMLEMVVNGVSTRKVSNIVEQLCGQKVSKSFVSTLTEKLDPIVNQWANRPLNTMYYPYIFTDAMYIKVREHNRVVSKAVYIATAVDKNDRREILGLRVDHVESCEAWQRFFQHLQSRGLQAPKLIISDAHKGLKAAIGKEFVGSAWQRCTVHFKKNIITHMPKKDMDEVKIALKRIFEVAKVEDARRYKNEFIEKYKDHPKLDRAIEILEDGFEDGIQYLNEDTKYHKHIRSTNSLERINGEVRRRERVIRIFPNTQSAYRLIGAVLMDYAEEVGKRIIKEKKQ
ncbi:IS256 family transposase [Cytobacillus firmus]|uniref:Mutator family transposase n=1 Tax=Cytobacillus firmus TaxID=1399 RepID=A0A380XY79_CYTFI|nr:IS256 family transposase [Cytobacillus firmus]EGW8978593.1 IS256 family transposase [Salmonella enterica subsp. enterica serovar 4,[5],12:i:-]KAF0821185.1 Mobile element protein [Cytobacillus firmus]MBG9543700.1 transposase [Cytobacillus firmus]MBG9544477.1 transposase [Cytobacillus firmus]MBG9544525.1 transposase [Cytobacillus firmus]